MTPEDRIAQLEQTVEQQRQQLVWATAAIKQIQQILSPTQQSGRVYESDPSRNEVGMGPILSPSKASFV